MLLTQDVRNPQNKSGLLQEGQIRGAGQEGPNVRQDNVSLDDFTATMERTNPAVEWDKTSSNILNRTNSMVESLFILVCLVLILIGRYVTDACSLL